MKEKEFLKIKKDLSDFCDKLKKKYEITHLSLYAILLAQTLEEGLKYEEVGNNNKDIYLKAIRSYRRVIEEELDGSAD